MGRLNARNIDDEVLKKFKTIVIPRHGKLHGAFSEELTEALQLYLEAYSEEGSTHTHRRGEKKDTKDRDMVYMNGGSPTNKGKRTYETIKSKTSHLVNAVYNGGDVSVNAFKRIIREYAGLDPRTIKKYLNLLFEEYDLQVVRGYVRPIGD